MERRNCLALTVLVACIVQANLSQAVERHEDGSICTCAYTSEYGGAEVGGGLGIEGLGEATSGNDDYEFAGDSLASAQSSVIPNMIGDSSAGGCGGLRIGGALVATIGHPTYACSRLNIAENNSPVLRDRAFVSYRHFRNASIFDVFSYSPQGRRGDFDIDQVTFGMEKRLCGKWSAQVQLPINSQLGSDLTFMQTDSGSTTDGSNNNLDDILANGTATEVGNLSVVLKRELYQNSSWYWSAGVGVNIPTAPDLHLRGNIDDPNFQVYEPPPSAPGTLANGPVPTGDALEVSFDGLYTNETVNVQPFLAGLWTPTDTFFMQGFLQVDVPVNDSFGSISYNSVQPDVSSLTESGKIGMQTLLRLNAGAGLWLYRDECSPSLNKAIAAMAELHYATTLNDPDAVSVVIPTDFGIAGIPTELNLDIAGLGGRVDNLNAVFGLPVLLGQTTVYNGFTVPLREDFDRGFDFEYSLIVDRRF